MSINIRTKEGLKKLSTKGSISSLSSAAIVAALKYIPANEQTVNDTINALTNRVKYLETLHMSHDSGIELPRDD